MKSIFESFKSMEFNIGVEFLNERDMQKIRGGAQTDKPKTRPREILPDEDE